MEVKTIAEQEEVLFDGSETIDYSEESNRLDQGSSSDSSPSTVYVKLAPGTNHIKFLGEGKKVFKKFVKDDDGNWQEPVELDEETVEEIEERRNQLYTDLYGFVNDTDEAENVDELREIYEEELTEDSADEVEELLDELDEVEEELDRISKQVEYPIELVDGELIAGDDRITETEEDTTYIYSVTYASTKSSQWGQLVDLANRKGGLEGETIIIKRDGTDNNTQYSVLDPENL